MRSSFKIVLVAVVAGVVGIAATLLATGPAPLLRSQLGQRVLGWISSSSAPAGHHVAGLGDVVQTMQLADLDGNSTDFPGKYAGKPLLVNVWATWCAPCRREMPELQRFSSEQGANGVQVVGIALDDSSSVHAFLEQVRVDYPILLDSPLRATAGSPDAGFRLGNTRDVLPYSVLISPDGRLLKQRIGPFHPGEVDRWTAL